jgi:hypothetical protein
MTGPRRPGPLLSICIPTYNRRTYLEGVLAALAPIRARIDAEIVVSDDASTDDTASFLAAFAAREPQVRMIRQTRRLGGFANTIEVVRAARGRFAVYHGDDDRLAADGLTEALDFLQAHPDHAAVYAPVDSYDLATGRSLGHGLHATEVLEFDTNRRVELIDYICLGLTPEHAVYRTDALVGVIHDPQIYWSLTLLAAALRGGKVRFALTPFYRAVQSHWPGERRDQLFHRLMADTLAWETFRAGLEVILTAQTGLLAQPERLAAVRARIDGTIGQRQGMALDFLITQQRAVEFVHAYRMLALRGALPHAFAPAILFGVTVQAVGQVLADYRALHGFARIVLVGLGDVGALMTSLVPDDEQAIMVTAPDLAAAGAPDADTLLVVADRRGVEAALARGFSAHATRDFAALLAAFDLAGLPGPS